MPPKAPPPFVVNKKLVLHFDLQDVIIYQHQNKDLEVLKMVANCAWGKVEQKDQKSPQVWKLVNLTLSKTEPQPQQPLVSYRTYVQSLYPIDEKQVPEKRKENQQAREQLYLNFTKGPGAKLKTQIEKLLRSITLPKTLSDFITTEQQSKEEVSKEYRKLVERLTSGKYQILPAFYKLMMNLKKSKREFAVVFHARKEDHHEDLIGELNLFFNGEHPFYNGKNGTPLVKFDGSKNCKNFRLTNKNTCVLYRFGKQFQQDYATFGTTKTFAEKDIEGLKQRLLQIKDETKLCKSSEIYIYSHLLLKQSAAVYCIDNLGLMVLDQADYNTQEIYFSSRDVQIWTCLGERLVNKQGIYHVKVDVYELMKDVEFFIKNVEVGQKNMIAEIDRIEKGGEVKKQKEEEREKELSDAEYLKRNILPLLQGALRLVDIERPEDPISAIAFYCLKNQHLLVKAEEGRAENP